MNWIFESIIFYPVVFVFGLILGSFLNCVIWRLRENIRFWKGRSMCPRCRRTLAWYENIPLVSFACLGGRCRTCRGKISWQYPLVEMATALLFLLVAVYHTRLGQVEGWLFLRDMFFLAFLIGVFVYDFLYKQILPEWIWLGAIIGFFFNHLLFPDTDKSMLMGAMAASGFFLAQYVVSRGRWIGGGDIHLGFMLGIWLGWPDVLVALFFAYITGAVVAVYLLATKKRQLGAEIPFGTFLSVGAFFALYHGDAVVRWYLDLLR